MEIKSNQNKAFFYFLLLGSAFLTYRILSTYLATIVLAILVSILIRPIYINFFKITRKKKNISVFLSTLVLVLIIVGFFIPVFFLSVNQIESLSKNLNTLISENISTIENLDQTIAEVNIRLENLNLPTFTKEDIFSFFQGIINPTISFLQNIFASQVKNTFAFFTHSILFFSVFGYVLPFLPKLIQYIKKISPLDDKLDDILLKKLVAMSMSMFSGTFVIALAQGLTSGITLWTLGFKYSFFVGLIVTLFSIIPLGGGIILIPMAIIQILLGNVFTGLLILGVQIFVVSNLDNVLRPKLVSSEAKMPEVFVLLSVFGGVELFGFYGLIFGPCIMIFFATCLNVYLSEYKNS